MEWETYLLNGKETHSTSVGSGISFVIVLEKEKSCWLLHLIDWNDSTVYHKPIKADSLDSLKSKALSIAVEELRTISNIATELISELTK